MSIGRMSGGSQVHRTRLYRSYLERYWRSFLNNRYGTTRSGSDLIPGRRHTLVHPYWTKQ